MLDFVRVWVKYVVYKDHPFPGECYTMGAGNRYASQANPKVMNTVGQAVQNNRTASARHKRMDQEKGDKSRAATELRNRVAKKAPTQSELLKKKAVKKLEAASVKTKAFFQKKIEEGLNPKLVPKFLLTKSCLCAECEAQNTCLCTECQDDLALDELYLCTECAAADDLFPAQEDELYLCTECAPVDEHCSYQTDKLCLCSKCIAREIAQLFV
jgi:hypothetical protein